jgi:hypothetical protein
MKRIYCTLAILLLSSATPMWAQDYPPQPQGPAEEEPAGPGRGVARISIINGEVSVRRGNSGEVTAAAVNAPLLSGDTLLTGSNARAELQFDASSMVRIAANSEVRMGDLQYHHNQIQVALGLITFTVLRNSDTQNEIDLPSVAVHPTRPGAYRILVREDGTAEITVRGGEAEIANPKGSQKLEAGQTMVVRGSTEDPEFQVAQAIQQDEWDRWNGQRDQQLLRATSTRYVNPDINGAEDLDQYGRWVDDGSYGRVWVPQVESGWAPYSQGRWGWADDYGWSWTSYDPWGWAPYHYGRWYHSGFGWAWWPGAYSGPCYWSPALVGFFGFGGRVGFGFGFGSVGWVPLAPFEPFHRWWGGGFRGGYGGGFGGYRNTTIVNNVNIYNTYRNARVNGGVMGVNAANFGRGGGRFTPVSGSQLSSAGMVRGMLPVTPDRSSLRMADRSVNMSNFRQSNNTRFFSRSGAINTQQSRSVPFEQQRQAVQQASRGSFNGSQVGPAGNPRGGNFGGSQGGPVTNPRGGNFGASQGGPISNPRGGNFSGSQVGPSVSSPNGWNRTQGPAVQPQVVRPGGSDNGWRRFNGPSGPGSTPAPQGGFRSVPQPNTTPSPSYRGGNPSSPSYTAPRYGGGPSYNAPRNAPSYNPPTNSAPRYNPPPVNNTPRSYNAPSYSAPRYSPPPTNNAPPRSYNAPSYSAPRYNPPSAPSYTAPRYNAPSAPSYSAPRSYSPPPSYSAPHSSPSYSAPQRSAPSYGGGGGGGGYRGGGGGGGNSGGGGGGGSHSNGGGNPHHR